MILKGSILYSKRKFSPVILQSEANFFFQIEIFWVKYKKNKGKQREGGRERMDEQLIYDFMKFDYL